MKYAKWEAEIRAFEVTVGSTGSGIGTFKVIVHAATPDMARRDTELQNAGNVSHSVRSI